MNDCSHAWRFLPRIVVAFGRNGDALAYANAECVHCGRKTWAHGRADPQATKHKPR